MTPSISANCRLSQNISTKEYRKRQQWKTFQPSNALEISLKIDFKVDTQTDRLQTSQLSYTTFSSEQPFFFANYKRKYLYVKMSTRFHKFWMILTLVFKDKGKVTSKFPFSNPFTFVDEIYSKFSMVSIHLSNPA